MAQRCTYCGKTRSQHLRPCVDVNSFRKVLNFQKVREETEKHRREQVDDFYARTLNELAEVCHGANERWWYDIHTGKRLERNRAELLMLMVTELAECCEGERKNLPDDKLPHRRMAEVELADCIIRILDYSHAHAYDIGGAFIEKMEYNRSREDHTHKARLMEHGKKF